jgi:hypothetical protein
MAKNKPTGGKHKTARVNVGLDAQWHAVARKLAAKTKQPVTYLLIALLEREAKEQGIGDLPVPPWEADEAGE